MIRSGKMTPAGLAAFEKRKEDRSAIYSYENRPEKFDPEMETLFKGNAAAWDFFSALPPSYQKAIIYWAMSAKQPSTRLSRLGKLIEASAEGKRLF